MPQRRLQELSRCPGDRRIAGGDVVWKDVVADIEFGDVDVDAEVGQRMQEFVEASRVMWILRLQMSLQADDIESSRRHS